MARGDLQAYETSLSARLFRLCDKGWLEYTEYRNDSGSVRERRWSWTPRGALLV
jgi:hypothetical protein